jgi:hypothetical protein
MVADTVVPLAMTILHGPVASLKMVAWIVKVTVSRAESFMNTVPETPHLDRFARRA